jgi:hypothetical protein
VFAAAVLGAVAAVLAWVATEMLRRQAFAVQRPRPVYDLAVVEVGDGTVTLASRGARDPAWRSPGVYGLEWEGGYAHVSAIRAEGPGWVRRDVRMMEGQLRPGVAARVDFFAFPGDPRRAFGLPFEEVVIPGPLGGMPAWFVDAPGDAWALLVHGQNAPRREMLHELPALQALGIKALFLAYRNDEGAPPSNDGLLHFGRTEWEDVEAAASWALARGAKGLVLFGHSMGGGIVVNFLLRSGHAGRVRAAVLDAPMLDFAATVAPPGRPPLSWRRGGAARLSGWGSTGRRWTTSRARPR